MCRRSILRWARFCTWRFEGRSARRRWCRRRSTSGRRKQRHRANPDRTQKNPRSDVMAYPKNYRYTKEHEWINVEGGLATIGITDYAQHELGDVVFVELPKPGAKIDSDPHGGAWLIKVRLTNAAELSGLMDAAAYEAYIAAKGKEASA